MSAKNLCFEDTYNVLEVIEKGAFNFVRRCVHYESGKQFAVRIVDIAKLSTSAFRTIEDLQREAGICHSLKHHHIVQLLETYSSEGFYYMVFEYLQGCDLFLEIVERANAGFAYTETVASHYMKQILSAVRYCHDLDVIHCNIGPDSVMLATKDCSAPIKLGCFKDALRQNELQPSKRSKRDKQKHFTAPEIIRGFHYDKSADIWSCGVLLYTLLSGNLPFIGSASRLEELICRTKYEMKGPIWNEISCSAKDFISQMLVNDAVDRNNAKQLLDHPWIKQRDIHAPGEHLQSTVKKLQHFNAQRRLKVNVLSAVNSARWDNKKHIWGYNITAEKAEKLRIEDVENTNAVSLILESLDDLNCLKDSSYDSIMMENLLTDQKLMSTLQASYGGFQLTVMLFIYGLFRGLRTDFEATLYLQTMNDILPDDGIWYKDNFASPDPFRKGEISPVLLYDKIEQQRLSPPTNLPDEDTALIAQQIVDWIEDSPTELTAELEELHAILSRPHLRSLLQAHDVVAYEVFRENTADTDPHREPSLMTVGVTNLRSVNRPCNGMPYDKYGVHPRGLQDINSRSPDRAALLDSNNITRIRLVQFQKNTDEPMGITLKVDDHGRCIVARIIYGGMIHRQATLHVGDEIIEINGISVANQTVDSLQRLLRDARGNVTFKIVPTYRSVPPISGQPHVSQRDFSRASASATVYLKCMFDYDPLEDELIPCKQAGLSFRIGQILLVINKDDPNWWQVRKFSPDGSSGLVPSSQLQEWRLTQTTSKNHSHHGSINCSIFKKKKKDKDKNLSKRALADVMDMTCYEEVMKVPGFQRNTLVLLGAHGVGRRHIKNTLIEGNPDKYAYPLPHTTRARRPGEEEGHHYFFVDQDEMLRDIATNQYLEYGSHEGAVYGTRLETIKRIINSGKMAILDVEPQALKMLRCADFSPFVVFIAAPPSEAVLDLDGSLGRLNRESTQLAQSFGRWFDLTIVNSDIEETIQCLRDIIDRLLVEEQWVPVNWVYR